MEVPSSQLWSIVRPRFREYISTNGQRIGLVAHVTSSSPITVKRWLANGEPNGERLIKLWYLLAALGCESPELNKLDSFNRLCGDLLTFGVMSLDDLQAMMGVQHKQPVLMMLRGGTPLRKLLSYAELRDAHADQLDQLRKEVLDAWGVQSSDPQALPAEKEVHEIVTALSTGGDTLLVTAALLGALLPLARHLDSDDCTPQDRSKLRSLMGEDGMFELSNHFNRLCSERARSNGR